MRTAFTPLALFTIIGFFAVSCKKEKLYTQTYKGSISYIKCNVLVIDIDGSTGTGGGVRWTEPSGKEHLNAIMVKNFCYVSNTAEHKKITGSFTFRISKDDRTGEQTCGQYLCLADGPSAEAFVYDIDN